MAERRMFSKTIIDSDMFLDMPLSTQVLYFHLSMRADDDGFINNPKKISRMIGVNDDDMKLLIAKNFIIPFESGVVVIKHWKIHNYIRNDRYKETAYHEEKSMLEIDKNKAYFIGMSNGIPNDNQMETQVRLGKVSIGKDKEKDIHESTEADSLPAQEKPKKKTASKSKPVKHKHGEYQHVLLTDDEFNKLVSEYPNHQELIKFLDEYIEMKGYKAKSHYLAIRKWVVDAVKEKAIKQNRLNASKPKEKMNDILDKAIINANNETFWDVEDFFNPTPNSNKNDDDVIDI